MELAAAFDYQGRRLDRILRKALPDMPLSRIHRLLRKGLIMVDGKPAGPDARVMAGSVISVPALPVEPPPDFGYSPPVAGISVLWEGDGLLFINKPAGIPVHGQNSLDTLARAYLRDRLPRSLSFRPGPLHRLDRPTSGVIAFSTSLEGARMFSALTRAGRIKKQYAAILDGTLTTAAFCAEPLARDKEARKTFISPEGRPGNTRFVPLSVRAGYSLVMAEIRAGKAHQIRAHAAFLGHPLSGDTKYGGGFQQGGLFLHAYFLEFPSSDNSGIRRVRAPLPLRFRARLAALFGERAAGLLSSPEYAEAPRWSDEAVPRFD